MQLNKEPAALSAAGADAADSAAERSRHLVSATFNANSPSEDRNFMHVHKGWSVGGILDGHGGWQVADFACARLPSLLLPRVVHQRPGDEAAIVSSLERAFADVETSYIESVRNAYRLGFRDVGKVGACALVALQNENDLYIANCGDCRAVLGSTLPAQGGGQGGGKTASSPAAAPLRSLSTRLSRDHNARTPLEALLLRQEHPDEPDIVKCKNPHACYVKGRLQLTRALGDLYLKVCYTDRLLYYSNYYLLYNTILLYTTSYTVIFVILFLIYYYTASYEMTFSCPL
jgi:pyruvate dehydrogenase phosphatase